MTKKKDAADEIQEEMGPQAVPEELTEQGEEPGVEYYLFHRDAFYSGVDGELQFAESIVANAVNNDPIESKSDVLKFCRSAAPGTYVLVKVMDELEVAPPKEANIVRSNPRLKKPRKDATTD